MVFLRRVALLIVAALTLLVIGAIDGVEARDAWATWPGPLPLIAEGLALTVSAAISHPKVALVVVAVVVLPVLVGRLIALIPRSIVKDPQRMFTSTERRAGFDRSGDQCEMEDFFFFRCKRAAEHGDHWFPWSKGGATSMGNFVSGCARCNIAKSAKVPTFWETQRLIYRRRSYFPPSLDPAPGEKYARR